VRMQQQNDQVQAATLDVNEKLRDAEARLREIGAKTIGLPTIKERVEMLGGDIHIESGLGRGTRVTLELPSTQPEA